MDQALKREDESTWKQDGIVYMEEQIYIPNNIKLKEWILEENYDSVVKIEKVGLGLFYFYFYFYFPFNLFFHFLFLKQLGLGLIGHAITAVT